MSGPIEGLKRVIKEFLAANDIGCILQTTMIDVGNITSRLTMLTMEGEKEKLIETRDLLVLELNVKFAGIKYDTWDQNESDNPWPIATTIKPTPGSLTRSSSGYVDEKIAETFSSGDTLIDERIIKVVKNMGGHIIKAVNYAKPLFVRAAQTAGEIKQVYSRASSLTDGLVKNADFSYQNRTLLLNTQPCLDWTLLMLEVKKVFEITEQSAVNIYKKLDDGTLSQIIDISGIEAKERYYVKTDADALKKGSNLASTSPEMEQFFEKLKTDRKRSEYDIVKIREIFFEQGILFEDLMETGDLAITDGALERIGIAQFGLRMAILAVIKSNIQ